MYVREGHKKSKCYKAWSAMRDRCRCVNHPAYSRYGGRGITICAKWDDYDNFRSWAIRNGIAHGLTIDRKDNDGNYEPSNCRWTTRAEQRLNQSNVKWIEFRGERLTQRDWSKRLGICDESMSRRLKNWPLEIALTKEKRGFLRAAQ